MAGDERFGDSRMTYRTFLEVMQVTATDPDRANAQQNLIAHGCGHRFVTDPHVVDTVDIGSPHLISALTFVIVELQMIVEGKR
jgi:hypothetical protein